MYKLITAKDENIFQHEVNELMRLGYKLQGSPFVWRDALCQALIKPQLAVVVKEARKIPRI